MLALLLVWLFPQGAAQHHRDLEYAKVGDLSLKLDLHIPAEKTPRPVILFIHGGGWKRGDKNRPMLLKEFNEKGFAVASIVYRLSDQAKYPAAVDDCRAAVRWLRDHASQYSLDSERMGVFGLSAGGYLSLMVGLLEDDPSQKTSARVQAICSWFGPSDFTQGPRDDRAFVDFIGKSFKDNPEVYKQASPLTHVSKDDPPTLLVHGDKDPVVPIRHSETLEGALQEAGVEVTFISVKNGEHGWRGKDLEPSAEVIQSRTIEFFAGRLKP